MSTRERVTIADPKLQKLYEQHVIRWKHCTQCDLHKTRNKVVPYRGYLPCDILFVGEAPGESENALGFPFVGPAGQLLDTLIDHAAGGCGMYRARLNPSPTSPDYKSGNPPLEDCLGKTSGPSTVHRGALRGVFRHGFCNILACWPNIQDELSGGKTRPPNASEAVACRERLREIYILANPQIVVTLGKVAERFFCKLLRDYPPAPVYNLIHPSAILQTENPSAASLMEKRFVLQLATILKELKL